MSRDRPGRVVVEDAAVGQLVVVEVVVGRVEQLAAGRVRDDEQRHERHRGAGAGEHGPRSQVPPPPTSIRNGKPNRIVSRAVTASPNRIPAATWSASGLDRAAPEHRAERSIDFAALPAQQPLSHRSTNRTTSRTRSTAASAHRRQEDAGHADDDQRATSTNGGQDPATGRPRPRRADAATSHSTRPDQRQERGRRRPRRPATGSSSRQRRRATRAAPSDASRPGQRKPRTAPRPSPSGCGSAASGSADESQSDRQQQAADGHDVGPEPGRADRGGVPQSTVPRPRKRDVSTRTLVADRQVAEHPVGDAHVDGGEDRGQQLLVRGLVPDRHERAAGPRPAAAGRE